MAASNFRGSEISDVSMRHSADWRWFLLCGLALFPMIASALRWEHRLRENPVD